MVIYYDRDLVSEINTFAELFFICLLVGNFKYYR